jgi:sirohydrochlorin ferrochelatase
MKSLLIVAHGSRREESNNEVRDLVKKVAGMNHDFYEVRSVFLELAEPLIPDGIRAAIANGATKVVVLPYFLSAGRHVVEDIPADVEIVKAEYPDIEISIAPYLGMAEVIPQILLNQTKQ